MAASRLICTLVYLDGRQVTYPVTPMIQMQFERSYKVGINHLMDGNEGMNNSYKLAWLTQSKHAEDMPNGVMPTLDVWAETLDALEVKDEEVVPFVSAPSNGTSPNSASLQESVPLSS